MDHDVWWSPAASEDLKSIAEYIARDSEFYARAVVSRVLDVAKSLPEQPLIGRVVPELGEENVRERFVYSYRLVYKIEEEKITVLAIIHGKRLLAIASDRKTVVDS